MRGSAGDVPDADRGYVSAKAGRPPMTTAERLEAARRHQEQSIHERNRLLALLCTHYPAHLIPVVDRRPEWRWAVCIHLPSGVVAWRLNDAEVMGEFEFLTPGDAENRCSRQLAIEKADRVVTLIEHRVTAGHCKRPALPE
jgi:hypothetical protein